MQLHAPSVCTPTVLAHGFRRRCCWRMVASVSDKDTHTFMTLRHQALKMQSHALYAWTSSEQPDLGLGCTCIHAVKAHLDGAASAVYAADMQEPRAQLGNAQPRP